MSVVSFRGDDEVQSDLHKVYDEAVPAAEWLVGFLVAI